MAPMSSAWSSHLGMRGFLAASTLARTRHGRIDAHAARRAVLHAGSHDPVNNRRSRASQRWRAAHSSRWAAPAQATMDRIMRRGADIERSRPLCPAAALGRVRIASRRGACLNLLLLVYLYRPLGSGFTSITSNTSQLAQGEDEEG